MQSTRLCEAGLNGGMNIMSKSLLHSVATVVFLALCGITASGCRRAPPIPVDKSKEGAQGKGADEGIGPAAVRAFHYDPVRVNDDWTRYRDFLPRLNSYMAKADVQSRLRLADADRSFLTSEVHLTGADMTDLESAEFRTAD